MSRARPRNGPPGSPSAKADLQAAAAEAVATAAANDTAAQTGPAKKAAEVKAGKAKPAANPLLLTPAEAEIVLAGLNALNKGGGVDIGGAAAVVQLYSKLQPPVIEWQRARQAAAQQAAEQSSEA